MNKNIAFAFFFGLLILNGCKKEDITSDVQFLDHSYFGNCFLTMAGDKDEIVIRSKEEYHQVFDTKRRSSSNVDCSHAIPTSINFDKYSLIGTYTSGGGCNAEYERSIITEHGEIRYQIDVSYSGGCKMLIGNMNWALVPKIKKRTDVVFDVNQVNQF